MAEKIVECSIKKKISSWVSRLLISGSTRSIQPFSLPVVLVKVSGKPSYSTSGRDDGPLGSQKMCGVRAAQCE